MPQANLILDNPSLILPSQVILACVKVTILIITATFTKDNPPSTNHTRQVAPIDDQKNLSYANHLLAICLESLCKLESSQKGQQDGEWKRGPT